MHSDEGRDDRDEGDEELIILKSSDNIFNSEYSKIIGAENFFYLCTM